MKTTLRITIVVAAAAAVFAIAGCGGGGRSASRDTGSGVLISMAPWSPPTLEQIVRSTAVFENVTYYLPGLTSNWYLYDATTGYVWISAVGTQSGVSASMTNPFKRVWVRFIPVNYSNPATLNFYIDGQQTGTLNLSSSSPYTGYDEDQISYYLVADNLDENTTHTVTMEISTGTVRFDGWRMEYKNAIYNIDCSDANTLEYDALEAALELRDGIEAFAESYDTYPNPASFTALIPYLNATDTMLPGDAENPFTGDEMEENESYSAGDFNYDSTASSTYTLAGYGGRGTLITMTPNSVETDVLELTLSQPLYDHFATTALYVTFEGTSEDTSAETYSPIWADPMLSISGGVNGTLEYPATKTFNLPIVLNEGTNNIKVKLKSAYGQTIYLTRTITRDTTPPGITLIAPFPLVGTVGSQYATVTESPTKVKAYVEPGSTATLNGLNVTVDYLGAFEEDLALQEGDNLITITASDELNNTNTATYTIKFTPPAP